MPGFVTTSALITSPASPIDLLLQSFVPRPADTSPARINMCCSSPHASVSCPNLSLWYTSFASLCQIRTKQTTNVVACRALPWLSRPDATRLSLTLSWSALQCVFDATNPPVCHHDHTGPLRNNYVCACNFKILHPLNAKSPNPHPNFCLLVGSFGTPVPTLVFYLGRSP